jgi:hypothetical protein
MSDKPEPELHDWAKVAGGVLTVLLIGTWLAAKVHMFLRYGKSDDYISEHWPFWGV